MIGAVVLIFLGLVSFLTLDSGLTFAVAAIIAALGLVAYAYLTPCPMCGHWFYLRVIPPQQPYGNYEGQTTMFDAKPYCVVCGFEPGYTIAEKHQSSG